MERQPRDIQGAGRAGHGHMRERPTACRPTRQTPVSRRPRLSADAFKDYGARLTALAEYMAERGVAMTYHHHMGHHGGDRCRDRPADDPYRRPRWGLLVDTGHIAYAGGDCLAVTRRHECAASTTSIARTCARLCLAQARAEDWSFLDAVVAACSRRRETARRFRPPLPACWPISATAAGQWSRSSRIRSRRRRSNTP